MSIRGAVKGARDGDRASMGVKGPAGGPLSRRGVVQTGKRRIRNLSVLTFSMAELFNIRAIF
jgi:hypothetical protein